jgi:murein DD-endopeptidase MepM/ murein hydrolase activator NlpD
MRASSILPCAGLCLALTLSITGCDRGEDALPVNAAPAGPAALEIPPPIPAPSTGAPSAAPAGAPSADAGKKENARVPLRQPPVVPAPRRTGLVFGLPTDNDALLKGKPESFYMFVDRYTPAGAVQVWQGGSYGYVRNPRNTSSGEVFTKFHEGIDIAPLQRDAAGEPLDAVRAIADGTVVYCTPNAASNYGNYMVVEHVCGEDRGNFYSLYAHLRRMDTAAGTPVKRGQPIGLMGHTGDGIDRRRSHVHLELCLLLSDRFNDFYAKHYKLANPNGNFHGHNLIGMDVAAFLLAAHKDPGLTPDEFLKSTEPYYKVRIPNKGAELAIAHRYPWLRRPGEPASSWEISYNSAGVPLAIVPDREPCAVPAVSWVKSVPGYHSWNTRNHLGGSGATATLAPEGSRYQQLVTGDF